MALPMINDTREAYPNSKVTVLAPENLADLFISNPAVDRIMTIPKEQAHGLVGVMRIRDLLTPERFDVGYILPPSFGSAAGFSLGQVKERIGYISDGRRLLLTRPLAAPSPLNSEHRSKVYFDLLRRGAGMDIEYISPKFLLNEKDTDAANTLLSRFSIADADEFAVIAFRSVAESRRWGSENYARLAREIIERIDLKVLLIGSGDDQSTGDQIASDSQGRIVNLSGKTSLRELAGILSRGKVFIGNDSGPAHLAAAVGTPLVVLSGADDPMETTPLSDHKRMIRLSELPCISCVKNVCPLKGEDFMRCMRGISVSAVMDEVTHLLTAVVR